MICLFKKKEATKNNNYLLLFKVEELFIDEGFIPALAPAADYRVEFQAFIDEMGVQKQIHKCVAHASILPDEDETPDSSESQEAAQ